MEGMEFYAEGKIVYLGQNIRLRTSKQNLSDGVDNLVEAVVLAWMTEVSEKTSNSATTTHY